MFALRKVVADRRQLSPAAWRLAPIGACAILFALLGWFGGLAFAADVRVDDLYDPNDTADMADRNAAMRAITAAGEGGTVRFTSGATYMLPFHITPLTSQTFTSEGPGKATIRRSDSLVTTLIADAADGSSFIEVADPTIYTVGYYVTPVITGGAGGRTDGEPLLNRITAIAGNRLYLTRPLTQGYASGDRVVNQSRLVVAGNPSANLVNLRFDGNRAGNDEFTNWATSIDIHLSSTGTTIRDIEIVDSPGEALTVHGGDHYISDSHVERSGLAAVHFSAATNVVMERNRFTETNMFAELGGHASGAYEWSVRNVGITIRDSVIENAHGWAFGNIKSYAGNSDILIENNLIRNNQGTLVAHNSATTEGNRVLSLDFLGNEVVDSGPIQVTDFSPTQPLRDMVFADNRFWNSAFAIQYVDDTTLAGNRWFVPDGAELSSYLTTQALWPNVTLIDNVATPLPLSGDATLDGVVDRRDAAKLVANLGRLSGGTWTRGDFDFDGAVTLRDLAMLQANFASSNGGTISGLAVPEPSGFLMIVLGSVAMLARRVSRHGKRVIRSAPARAYTMLPGDEHGQCHRSHKGHDPLHGLLSRKSCQNGTTRSNPTSDTN